MSRISELCDRHRIKREFINLDIPRPNACTTRGLAMLETAQLAARESAPSLFDVGKMPNSTDNRFAEAMY